MEKDLRQVTFVTWILIIKNIPREKKLNLLIFLKEKEDMIIIME
jgi:hypothetical protein